MRLSAIQLNSSCVVIDLLDIPSLTRTKTVITVRHVTKILQSAPYVFCLDNQIKHDLPKLF